MLKSEQFKTDVVIAGGGLAGIVTAHELLSSGHRVLLIDKDKRENFGGLAKQSFGGVHMVDTPHQRRLRIKDSPELAWRDWQSVADYQPNDEWPRQWGKFYCEHSRRDIFEFLDSKRVTFLPLVNWAERGIYGPGNTVPRWHIVWGTGYEIIHCLVQALDGHPQRANLEFLFDTEVSGIESANGRATGVRGRRMDSGAEIKVSAGHVVIASGGICGGDLSRLRANWYKPWGEPPQELLNGAHDYGDGMLHDRVAELGGAVTQLELHWHYAAGVHHPARRRPNDGLSLAPPRSALWFNARGERIMTPGPMPVYGDTRHLVESVLRQPGKYSWQAMNWKIAVRELAVSGCDYMTAFRFKNRRALIAWALFGNKQLVERLIRECPDDFVVADNLDELMERMDAKNLYCNRLDREQMKATIEAWDAMIARGPAYHNDEQLRRTANFRAYRGDRIRTCKFQKILDPKAGPLIAIREFILARKTLGGIQTDLQCRVLRATDAQPIPGLYAVGEAAGVWRRWKPRQGLTGGDVPGRLYTHGSGRRTEHREIIMSTATQTSTPTRVRIGGHRTGAWLARYALEQLPVSHTFGIPGVHTIELYDELSKSEKICAVLPTHECCGAFAADAISRTAAGQIGCLVIVPAAGVTHAMSGIGECYLDGIPLLVITGGPRTDVEFGYQLHGIDQQRLVDGIVKRSWKVKEHAGIVPTIFEAYRTAVSGMPGPVLVEIPVNLQLFSAPVEAVPAFTPASLQPVSLDREIDAAVQLLCSARSPGIFVGWGAVDVSGAVAQIAEILGGPVSTTLQGLSAFSGNHPLHAGMGFSRAAVPAAENAFASCDCLLAIGVSFGEIPTGSFGCRVPEDLIHIDISREAIGRNFPAKVGLAGDSRVIVPELLTRLRARAGNYSERRSKVEAAIAKDKAAYREEWRRHVNDRVNPMLFFEELHRQLHDDAIMTVDDGNHTFLAAELFEVRHPRCFVSPTDFNSMGYAVPAAIGVKLANPQRQVVSIVGDGAFLMTGLETITAVTLGLEIAYFVFNDGELSQISQGQEIPYNRKSCTTLGEMRLQGIADAVGARYLTIQNNAGTASAITEALAPNQGRPVIVDVRIDYSKRTRFTQGVVKIAVKSFPFRDKLRFVGRALIRKITG